MATQFPTQPVVSPPSGLASQMADAKHPPSVAGVPPDAAAFSGPTIPRLGTPGRGTANLIAHGMARTNEAGAGNAISDVEEPGGMRLSPTLERLPVGLTVSVPVRSFRIRNLLAIVPGQLIETQWAQGDDLPLSSGDVQLAWSEFEVVETKLAVRVTRLA